MKKFFEFSIDIENSNIYWRNLEFSIDVQNNFV